MFQAVLDAEYKSDATVRSRRVRILGTHSFCFTKGIFLANSSEALDDETGRRYP